MSKVVLEAVERLVDALTPPEKLRIYQKVERATKRERLDELLRQIRRRAVKHPISDQELKRICDEVRQELYDARTRARR